MTRRLLIACFLILGCAGGSRLVAEVLHLPIGDPARRDRDVPLVLDGITDCHDGSLLTPAALGARLADVDLLFVGESHESADFHQIQLRVLEQLQATGRPVLIGLEMFPYTEQEPLDRWSAGLLTERGFLELAHWYRNWGYNWLYYRDIFLFARDHSIPMYAVNTPREVVRAVRKKGFAGLTEEEAAHIPAEIDTSSEEHRRLFKAFFEGEDFHASMTEEQWNGMFDAQCTWDASMGHNAVVALKAHGGEGAIMVVLIGAGHVAYGLGIQRQAAHWFDGRMAALIPIPIEDDKGERVETVRASYADLLWGVPPEGDPIYPVLGLSTTEIDGSDLRRVIDVPKDSVAERAGFAVGDVLVSMNGTRLADKGDLGRLMAELAWGDSASFTVERDGQTIPLEAVFRRLPEEEK